MLNKKLLKSINVMKSAIEDPEILSEDQFISIVQNCMHDFNRTIIYQKPPESRQEHDIITACTEAIDYFQRTAKRVTIENVAKRIKKNKWETRNLMVKHGLYNPHEKKFKNIYKEFILSNNEPDWENGFYGG